MNLKELNSDSFYNKWILAHSVFNIIGVGLVVWMDGFIFWLLINLCSFSYFISKIRLFLIDYPAAIGYANWVTLVRLGIVFVGGALLNSMSYEFLFVLFTFSVLLDGVDGYVARKFKHLSIYGARLDMETDAFLVMMLSLYHVQNAAIPQWILLPALMRFIFGLVSYFVATHEVTTRMFRATIAVSFFISLLLVFILPSEWTIYAISISGGLILISFGLSFYGMFINAFRFSERKSF